MEELAPHVFDWTTWHEGIGHEVHSHLLADTGLLLDPRLPDEGLDWFAEHGPPRRIVLTNRHHLRHSQAFADRFSCPVYAHTAGMWDLPDRGVTPFLFGEQVAPGVVAHEVGVLTPEETAIHAAPTAERPGVLALADCVMRDGDGPLRFVADGLLGDAPEAVKAGLRARLLGLCDELDFDVLLLAHGAPTASGGRDELRAFAAQ